MKHPSFLFLAAGLLCLAACSKSGQNNDAQAGTVYKVKVQTAQAQPQHFRKQIRVQGTIQAYIFTNVAARAIGNMELKVDDGDAIKEGQTLFLRSDMFIKRKAAKSRGERF